MSEAKPDSSVKVVRKKRKRRLLVGCGLVAVILVVLMGGCALVARNNLGQLVSGLVRDQSSEFINGYLEYDNHEIGLTGRVVLEGIRIYSEDSPEPLITCEKAVVAMDFLTFAGPNRGKRAVVIDLDGLDVTLIREADGQLNLQRLIKQSAEKQDPMGVSLRLNNARIDFTDHCLLAQEYPRIDEAGELVSELLDELGYDLLGQAEVAPHHEVLRLDGSFNINSERGQMGFKMNLLRESEGGVIGIHGSANQDFSEFDTDVTLKHTDASSFSSYLAALFPTLQVSKAGSLAAEEQNTPSLALMLDQADLCLIKRKGDELAIEAKVKLSSLYFASEQYPALKGNFLELDYSTKQQTIELDLDLSSAGLHATGTAKVEQESSGISGTINIEATDIADTLAALGMEVEDVSGALSAQVELSGTAEDAQILARLTGGAITAQGVNLGKPAGELTLQGTTLSISKLKFSGGDFPVNISGSYDTIDNNGDLNILCSPVKASKLMKMAQGQSGTNASADLKGDLRLELLVKIKDDRPNISLAMSSSLLTIDDAQLTAVTLSANVAAPNIVIHSVEAVVSSLEPVDIAGFTSDGPLRAALRIGGSVSQLPGDPVVLSLVGTLKTANLSPDQATASFKVLGPADDPEIRVQLKTSNKDNPLVLRASGHYKDGPAKVEANLNWFNTSVNFGGKVDFSKQTVNGNLTATDVDLRRFSGNDNVSGKLTATAKVSGTFEKPSLSGEMAVPMIRYAAGQRSYSVAQLGAGFKLIEGDSISILNGSLLFDGQEFSLAGVLGQSDSELSIACPDFNLLSAVSLAPTSFPVGNKSKPINLPLDISSSGPLSIKLSGDMANPKAKVTYQSGPGQVEGSPFKSLAVMATAGLGGVSLDQFDLSSDRGSISLYGTANFEPFGFTLSSTVESFDVALLAPLSGKDAIQGLTGLLEGSVQASGDAQKLIANGDLKLVNGRFQDVEIHEARAKFSAAKDKVRLDELVVKAAGTSLSGSGMLGLEPSDFTFDAEAGSLDLALLRPFLPAAMPNIQGTLGLDLKVRPSRSTYPNIDLTLSDSGGGIGLGEGSISKVNAKITVRKDIMQIKRIEIGAGSSSLVLSGKLDLLKAADGDVPLDMQVTAEEFEIGDILGFVPKKLQDYVPGGEVNCKLSIRGNKEYPDLEGWLSFEIDSMPYGIRTKPFGSTIVGASGKLNFLRNQGFDIERISLQSGGETSLQGVQINGSGFYSTNPPGLRNGGITISLAQGGRYTALYDEDAFRGSVGGLITILGKQGEVPLISGNLLITAPGEKSMYIHAPTKGEEGNALAPFKFKQFEVILQEGTQVYYNQALANMNTELQGSLMLNGRPGVRSGSDAFSIAGELKATNGSMLFYKHIVRLEGDTSRISFNGGPGELLPYFTGTGKLVLARVVADDLDTIGSGAPVGNTTSVDKQDLEVFFHFQNVKLGPDETTLDSILLTSNPTMPRDRILAYLGGVEALLAGDQKIGEFAEGEILAFGSSFITRAIEESFNLRSLRFGGTGQEKNPFYMDVEKQLSPQMSLSYYRDFFDESTYNESSERFGVKYNILHNKAQGNRYQNLDLKLNFEESGYTGNSREFMFEWTTRF